MTTPSLPTSLITSAIRSPISLLSADMVATCEISSFFPEIFSESRASSSTTTSTPLSSPRLIARGFAPAVTFLMPSATMLCARSVAVVVPSPATSFVLFATSLTSSAPIFSILSGRSISFAMVTPSFVICGDPKPLSKSTFRPLGPKVTFTAFASLSTPRLSAWRASSEYIICLAILF